MARYSGIIMHISSLPGNYGIGTLGEEAFKFVDFLKKSGQKYWQILPLGQTGYGDSPYQCFSAFAGNPYFIDFDKLNEKGLLDKKEYKNLVWSHSNEKVDYYILFQNKMKILKIAYYNAKNKFKNEIEEFRKKNSLWIEDYALFMAIKNEFNLASWQKWPNEVRNREKEVIKVYKEKLCDEINYWIFLQFIFFQQWNNLKSYANSLEVKIIGDIPIYVSEDSSDIWANSRLFLLDDKKAPIKVAGCPPDSFSFTGQLWGNPLYNWNEMGKEGYKWWIDRIKENLKLYDVIRIDHFRGFEAYWEIPYGDKTAINGRWIKGPGIKLFKIIKDSLGNLPIIAEDLGYLTDDVIKLREDLNFPGMKVLQFAFDSDENNQYLPHNYEKNCVVYTGTHDNDTILGWFNNTGSKKEIQYVQKYLNINNNEMVNWGLIREAWSSVADVAITTMQDFLDLGSEARMNFPSTLGANWQWRAREGVFTHELAKKIYNLTKLYGRCES